MGTGRFFPLILVMAFGIAGCSPAKFRTSKTEVLAKSSVFGDQGAIGTASQESGEGGAGVKDASGSVTQVGRIPANIDSDEGSLGNNVDEVPVTLVCSDGRSRSSTNFKKAVAQNLPVKLTINGTSCTSDKSIIQSLIVKPVIARADLTTVCAAALPQAGTQLVANLDINGEGSISGHGKGDNGASISWLSVLWARNSDTSVPAEAADGHCDQRSSPLVVHIASDVNHPKPIALSSRQDGIFFDLLGLRSAHRPVQISWFTNHEYRMLALPNKRGEVRGIDELFGDNTAGPDQRFAANGYAALAKYDGTTADGRFRLTPADGVIDQRDPIFNELRLWLDRNFDGVGSADEMVSLPEVGLAYIDLDFSSDYAETDQYGNQTKMKSVVGYRDGSLDLIFDLWFSYRLN